MTRALRRAATTVIASMLATTAGVAQQGARQGGDQSVFKDSINLIQISIVVSGPDGQPVHGLKSEDFTVIAHGERRPVDAFAEISAGRAPASPFPATLASDVSDNADAKADRIVVLVLDDLHLEGQTDEVKSLARRVVNGLGTGTSLGLITTSGDFGMEPTADRARVLQVIDRFIDQYDPRITPTARAAAFSPIGHAPPDLGKFFADMTLFKASQDVAKMLANPSSSRKAFVWLSKGMPKTCPQPPDQRPYVASNSYDHACDSMLYQMQRSDVSTYAVNPGGGSDHFLSGVTEATGGIEIRPNDLDAGIDRLVDDLNNYYLLGFTPADPKDAKYRDLEIGVNRPGLTLRYRHGYSAAAPPVPKEMTGPSALVGGVLPKSDLHLRASAVPLAAQINGESPVVLSLEVHGDAGRFTGPSGWLRDTLKYEIVAVDLEKKHPVLDRTENRSIAWRPVSAPEQDASYLVDTVIDLPPGSYQVRMSGDSAAQATAGSVYVVFDVPDIRRTPLTLGGLLLGYVAGSHASTIVAQPPGAELPFAPTLDRQFDTIDRVRLLCDVTRSPGLQDVDATVALVDASDRVVRSSPIRIGATDAPRIDMPVDFAGLEPGAYRIRITAASGSTHAMREVGVLVR